MPKSTQPPSHKAIRRLEPYARPRHVAPEPRRRSPVISQQLSIHSDIFVRTLMADLQAEEEKADRNKKLELCLFVDVIPGKNKGCFVDPDLFILMLSVWSPLPMPFRPMATVQLDRFVGVDRTIPTAPLWLANVHGTRTVPLKFFRTTHWVREQVRAMLSFPITALGPDTFRDYSLLVEKIDELIVSFEWWELSKELSKRPRVNPPPRPRPLRRQLRCTDEKLDSGILEENKEDDSCLPLDSGPSRLDV